MALFLLLAGCSTDAQQPTPAGATHDSVSQTRTANVDFVRAPGANSQHPTIDRAGLLQTFPLASLGKVDGDIVSSPLHLAVIEQVRLEAAKQRDLGKAIPVDLFLWASGAPPEPHLTKLGGVPHRERNRTWPKNKAGEAMTFVVQFCFADSRDILDVKLPGDVLLVFFGEDYPWPTGSKAPDVHLEWSSIAIENPLRAEDMPKPGISIPLLHGVRHRSNEYPDSFYEQDPDVFTELGYDSSYHFAITQSTSIGHSTWFIQNDPTSRRNKLIAALSSFQLEKVWPLANQKKLATLPELMFYDVGCYYFLLDWRGRVTLEFSCY